MIRGGVHRVRLPAGRGLERHGPRFAVVVQADELLGLSTALVAQTSRAAAPATFRPQIVVDGEATRVLVEQTRAVDTSRLGEVVGHLSHDEQRSVNDALETVLGL